MLFMFLFSDISHKGFQKIKKELNGNCKWIVVIEILQKKGLIGSCGQKWWTKVMKS